MLVFILLLFCLCRIAQAMQASPFPFTVSQPSGQQVTLFLRGSEYNHALEDTQGYTVVKSQSDANLGAMDAQPQYVYATLDAQGNLAPSQYVVGATDPAAVGLQRKIAPAVTSNNEDTVATLSRRAPVEGERLTRHSAHSARSTQSSGTVNNLVVMVRWSDSPFQTRTASTPGLPTVQDLTPIFNGATNSVQDVYRQNSYGELIVNSVFTDWITVSVTEKDAAMGRSGLTCCSLQNALASALAAAERNGINFANFDQNGDGEIDMITFLHSGYGAEWGGPGFENVCDVQCYPLSPMSMAI